MAEKAKRKKGGPQSLSVLAVIPARGGSKGLPGKHTKLLAGKALICYTIEAALASAYGPRVIVSTDNEQIAETARAAGAEVPFMRHPVLAEDATPMFPVIKHALEWLKRHENYRPGLVALLQPTSPLRTAAHIDDAIQMALEKEADSVVSVCEAEHSPYWMQVVDEKGGMKPFVETGEEYVRRQDLPKVYRLNGAIFVTRPELVKRGRFLGEKTRPLLMKKEHSVDIDDEIDFLLAELLISRRQSGAGNHR